MAALSFSFVHACVPCVRAVRACPSVRVLDVRALIVSSLQNSSACNNRELTEIRSRSQSPVFGLAVLYPTGSEISRFWYIKTRGRKLTIEFFFVILSSTLWRFYRANKKSHIHLKK